MTRQEALAIYRRNGLLLAQINGLREDVAERLAILETERDEARDALLAAHAAGYARAERDVAEAAKKQATKKRERDWSGDEVAACALEDFADNIEQDAYRGAAKDEAPRGEEET